MSRTLLIGSAINGRRQKKWIELHALLFLLDESGFSEVSPRKRTWALRGETPTRYTSLNHNERLNLIGGLGVTPAKRKIMLHLQSYRKSITGEEVILFLTHLLDSESRRDRPADG